MTYRFVGIVSELGSVTLNTFGQRVELNEQQAVEAIRGHCPILPESDFESIGFTEEEVNKYAAAGRRQEAPESFQQKRQAAWNRLHELRSLSHESAREQE